jgi:hypothetical protein
MGLAGIEGCVLWVFIAIDLRSLGGFAHSTSDDAEAAGRRAPFRHSMGVTGSVMQMRRTYAIIPGAENAGLRAAECSGTTPGIDRAQKEGSKR